MNILNLAVQSTNQWGFPHGNTIHEDEPKGRSSIRLSVSDPSKDFITTAFAFLIETNSRVVSEQQQV